MTLIGIAAAALAATPAGASGNAVSGFTVGDCMSDVLYGNEPNIVDPFASGGPAEQEPGTIGGRVVPSQSPGPFVNNPLDPDNPTRGRSAGGFMQDGINVPQLCQDAAAAF